MTLDNASIGFVYISIVAQDLEFYLLDPKTVEDLPAGIDTDLYYLVDTCVSQAQLGRGM